MQEFYFQVLIVVFASLITGFIGWVAVVCQALGKQGAAFEQKFESMVDAMTDRFTDFTNDISTISADVKELRKYDTQITTLHVQLAGMERRLTDVEHVKKQARG